MPYTGSGVRALPDSRNQTQATGSGSLLSPFPLFALPALAEIDVLSAENPNLSMVPSFKPDVCQDLASHALPAASDPVF